MLLSQNTLCVQAVPRFTCTDGFLSRGNHSEDIGVSQSSGYPSFLFPGSLHPSLSPGMRVGRAGQLGWQWCGQTIVALLAWQSEGAGILWEGDLGSLHFGEGFSDPSLFFSLLPKGTLYCLLSLESKNPGKEGFQRPPNQPRVGGCGVGPQESS